MIRKDVQIINRLGLHARAAAKFVSCASAFSSNIHAGKDGQLIDGGLNPQFGRDRREPGLHGRVLGQFLGDDDFPIVADNLEISQRVRERLEKAVA